MTDNASFRYTSCRIFVAYSLILLFGQVFNNLISNAIKFTPEGSVTVHARAGRTMTRQQWQALQEWPEGEQIPLEDERQTPLLRSWVPRVNGLRHVIHLIEADFDEGAPSICATQSPQPLPPHYDRFLSQNRFSLEHLFQEISIDIVDEGAGIKEHFMPRLFDRFSKAYRQANSAGHGTSVKSHGDQGDDASKTVVKGTGLGLSICKELAHLMGATLTVKSREGVGSVFSLRMLLPTATHSIDVLSVDKKEAIGHRYLDASVKLDNQYLPKLDSVLSNYDELLLCKTSVVRKAMQEAGHRLGRLHQAIDLRVQDAFRKLVDNGELSAFRGALQGLHRPTLLIIDLQARIFNAKHGDRLSALNIVEGAKRNDETKQIALGLVTMLDDLIQDPATSVRGALILCPMGYLPLNDTLTSITVHSCSSKSSRMSVIPAQSGRVLRRVPLRILQKPFLMADLFKAVGDVRRNGSQFKVEKPRAAHGTSLSKLLDFGQLPNKGTHNGIAEEADLDINDELQE